MVRHIFILLLFCVAETTQAQFDFSNRVVVEERNLGAISDYGDLNNDGHKDIVSISGILEIGCGSNSYKISWKENIGDGSFYKSELIYEFESTIYDEGSPMGIKLGDYDSDGDIDLVAMVWYYQMQTIDQYYYVLEYFENNGDGTFQPPYQVFNFQYSTFNTYSFNDLLDFDINEDGDIDFIISIDKRFFRVDNLGNGNFFQNNYTIQGYDAINLIAVDLNNDGFKEIVAKTAFLYSGNYRVFYVKNNGGTLEFNSSYNKILEFSMPKTLNVADIDNDGFNDLIVSEHESSNYEPFIYLNNGSGDFNNLFGARQSIDIGGDSIAMYPIDKNHFIEDFDHDGDIDIIYNSYNDVPFKLINEGNLTFTKVPLMEEFYNNTFYDYFIKDINDINNDGNFDAIILNEYSLIFWIKSDNIGNFSLGNAISLINTIENFHLFDIDGNGVNEMIFCLNGLPIYFEQDSAGRFSSPKLVSKNIFSLENMQPVDLNNDSILDFLSSDQYVLLDINDNIQIFDIPINIDNGDVLLFDYDYDGDIDIGNANSNELLINDGQANFSIETINIGLGGYLPLKNFSLKDINNDGFIDYLSRSFIGGHLYLNFSTGPYQYDHLTIENEFWDGYYYQFIDVNIDGKKDILYTKPNGSNSTIEFLVRLNLGNNQFSENEVLFSVSYDDYFDNANIYISDVNYDGKFDVLISHEINYDDEKIQLYLQNNDGTFQPADVILNIQNICSISGSPNIQISDFDNDAINDLAISNPRQLVVMKNEFIIDLPLLDFDEDGVYNVDEDLNNNGNYEDDDTDGDGIPNYFDTDDDGDTVLTNDEITGIGAGFGSLYEFIDTDGDSIENYLDIDDDGDTTLTINEDYNGNGNPKDDDLNTNGIPDFLDYEVNLGIESPNLQDLELFPNPTNESIILFSTALVSETKILLYSVLGQLALEETVIPQNAEITVDVSSLKNGIYFIKITAEGNSVTKKLIKI